jgi:hypothetical protein
MKSNSTHRIEKVLLLGLLLIFSAFSLIKPNEGKIQNLPDVICQNQSLITIGSEKEEGIIYTSNLPEAAFFDNKNGTAFIAPMNVKESGEYYVIAKKGGTTHKQAFQLIGVPKNILINQSAKSKDGLAKFNVDDIEKKTSNQLKEWKFEGVFRNQLGADNQTEVSQYLDIISINKATTVFARMTNVNGCTSIVAINLNLN